jgi:hypothetical protein
MKKIFTLLFAALMSANMFGENVLAGIKAPAANCPTSVSLCVMPTPDQGQLFEMEFNTSTGWFVAYHAQANEDDMFKIVDTNNPSLVLCKYSAEDDNWVQAVMRFGDVWADDTWKGDPVKWVEIDMSGDEYAWLEGKPEPSGISVVKDVATDKGACFDLNGRKLDGKPTQKGIYIKNGRKLVIK